MKNNTHRFSGARLRAIRQREGFTQAELARRAGVRERQIIRWENDQNEPRIDAVSSIAAVTGDPLEAFFATVEQEAAPRGDTFRSSARTDAQPSDRRKGRGGAGAAADVKDAA